MKLENQVVSLELSKRLKELGVKQESAFYFETITNDEGDRAVTNLRFGKFYDDAANKKHVSYISAFTVAELGELLPINFRSYRWAGHPDGEAWFCNDDSIVGVSERVTECTEADIRAKMLIYLIEKGIVKP